MVQLDDINPLLPLAGAHRATCNLDSRRDFVVRFSQDYPVDARQWHAYCKQILGNNDNATLALAIVHGPDAGVAVGERELRMDT